MASLSCPSCDKKLKVPDTVLGKKIKCPSCAHVFSAATSVAQAVTRPAKTDRKPSPPADDVDVRPAPARQAVKAASRATLTDDEEEDRASRAVAARKGNAKKAADEEPEDDEDDVPQKKTRGKKSLKPSGAAMATATAVPMVGALAGLGVVVAFWGPGAGFERLLGPLLMAAGLFSLIAAVLNWEWFMTFWSEQAAERLGSGGLRVMYVGIGLALVVVGVLGAMGVVDLKSRR